MNFSLMGVWEKHFAMHMTADWDTPMRGDQSPLPWVWGPLDVANSADVWRESVVWLLVPTLICKSLHKKSSISRTILTLSAILPVIFLCGGECVGGSK